MAIKKFICKKCKKESTYNTYTKANEDTCDYCKKGVKRPSNLK
jgi:uncharacterized CHY-type Zn-finger protein